MSERASQYYIPPFIEEMFRVSMTEEDVSMLRETLSTLRKPVKLKLFTSKDRRKCFSCAETEKLLTLLQESSPPFGEGKTIELDIVDISEEHDLAKKYGIEKPPTILLLDGAITYLGMPAGEELKGFIETIIRISTDDNGLAESTVKELANLQGKAVIEVIVTPPCPYCPYAALMANMFAFVSKVFGKGNVKSYIVEAYEFPEIADKYSVTTVPTIAVNGRVVFIGLPYEGQLLRIVKRIASLYE